MNTFEQMRGRSCVEFVDWLDVSQRQKFAPAARRFHVWLSDLEVNEAWGNLLFFAWSKKTVADEFVNESQFYRWLLSTLRTTVGFMRSNELQRRGLRNAPSRPSEAIMSEFEDDDVRVTFGCQLYCEFEDWSPSKWYVQVLDSMTLKQRIALEAIVVAGMAPYQVKQLSGVPVGWRSSDSCISAIKKARRMIESGTVDPGPSYRVA